MPFIHPKIPSELRRLWSALWDVVGRPEMVADPLWTGGMFSSRLSIKDWWKDFTVKFSFPNLSFGGGTLDE
jgi:hypothetical protein